MTESSDSRALVPFAAALSGFIAVLFAVFLFEAALAIYETWARGQLTMEWWGAQWVLVTSFFVLLSGPAVMVMGVAGTLVHFLISGRGLTSQSAHVVGTSSIVGGCYLLCVLGEPRLATPEAALLVPAAAIPSGLFFHHVMRMRNVPPLDRRDGLIVATWIAGWAFVFIAFGRSVSEIDPWHQRYEVLADAVRVGLLVFMLSGVAAGIARLSSVRLGMGILVLAWLIPAFFAVKVFSTPLGPTRFHFSLADQEFEIDWRLKPRGDSRELCIDTHDSGLFTGFRSGDQWGLELCVSRISDPLVPDLPPLPGDEREAGLTCRSYNVEVGVTGKVCSVADADGRTIAKIRCPPGWCSLWFDADELRYSLNFSPPDFASWSELQKRAVQIIAKFRVSKH